MCVVRRTYSDSCCYIIWPETVILKSEIASGVDVQKFLARPWPGAASDIGTAIGIGAAHMLEYVPTSHQPMTILFILGIVLLIRPMSLSE